MRFLAACLLILGLSACDGEDPVTRATREISAANHAAAAVAQAKAEAEATAKTDAATPPIAASCDVEVSFGSYGAGVDAGLRNQIRDLTRDDPDVTTSTEARQGREGESTLCLKARDARAADRLYGVISARLPSTPAKAPTSVRHRDGRSHATPNPAT